MDWIQVLVIIGSQLAMWLWLRTEASADRREARDDRREITQLIFQIQQEMKDFHGRLCAIEERNRSK